MLIELFDLYTSGDNEYVWKESSRWYKYEETVEGVDGHRGRPHVSFLSYNALYELRNLFLNGIIMLDPHVYSVEEMINAVKTRLENDQNLDPDNINSIISILSAKKHRCQAGRINLHQSGETIARKFSVTNNPLTRTTSTKSAGPTLSKVVSVDSTNPSTQSDTQECSQIYTGLLDSLPQPQLIMIRLPYGMHLPEITDKFVHMRFVYLIVGPMFDHLDYLQIGRCLATLMANKEFQETSMTATGSRCLITAIDSFLMESCIIPPGDIDDSELFNLKNLKRALRRNPTHAADRFEDKAPILKKSKSFDPRHLQLDKVKDTSAKIETLPVTDPFVRTGRPFGGVINDIKIRSPYYWDDIKTALNFQCVTSILFIFFTNFANAIAIGEVLGVKTDGWMGVSEILISHAICGVVWGLIAGQPLSIMAAVGPFLVFEESLYNFCQNANVNFLATRFWTGLWTFLFMILLAMVEAPFLMKHLNRFTEDIFTGLIAVIFLWTAGKFIYFEFQEHPLQNLASYCLTYDKSIEKFRYLTSDQFHNISGIDDFSSNFTQNDTMEKKQFEKITNQPDTALLAFLLFLATFVLAFFLRKLRLSIYCGRTIRRAIGDFGVPLAILIVTFFDQLVLSDSYTRHISMKPTLDLTSPNKRNWLVNPLGTEADPFPRWMIPASILPAILVTILLYLEVEIIASLLSKKERHLKKPPTGFHWDLIVCGGLGFVCTIFGLQWMCPAAVQSLAHAQSLSVMKKSAPGEAPQIDHVLEQRVTTIIIGLLHAVAACLGTVLSLIPTSALFGLFFYLGVMGLLGIQFWSRIVLYFVPEKYFPDEPYCQDVSMKRMHFYTFLQLLCFAVLWTVNLFTTTALAFPFVLILIAVFRKFVVSKMFSQNDLIALEGKQADHKEVEKDKEPNKDFYDH